MAEVDDVSTVWFDGRMLHVGDRVVGNVRPNSGHGEDLAMTATRHHRSRRVRVLYESGWELSVVWGTGTYSSNYRADSLWGDHTTEWTENPKRVEIAAMRPDEEMVAWPDGDTVQGHVGVTELQRLIDYMATWPSGTFKPTLEWRDAESED